MDTFTFFVQYKIIPELAVASKRSRAVSKTTNTILLNHVTLRELIYQQTLYVYVTMYTFAQSQ